VYTEGLVQSVHESVSNMFNMAKICEMDGFQDGWKIDGKSGESTENDVMCVRWVSQK